MPLDFGMPPGFQALLDRKYAIMQQQADTQATGINAAARLDTVRANLLPAESQANTAEAAARTTNLGLTGRTIVPLANANINLLGAQTTATGAEAENTQERTIGLHQLNRRRPTSSYGLGGGGFGGGLTRLGF